ncbi:ribosomal protein L7/L12 [Methylococcus sp. EFPC2]|uniref:ribosomal protein L7/L12 n=1 Tax=Methylococcus sp. EFPC2 TaxID=2812648 RepID=UPI001967D827|nr:ribosomal protein L7/L12 [Methylococcus sp. EFPC2]QSA97574.1 ribosomal protein L7/L12 [Methylococcus sp. EFPC2]
MDLNNLGIPKDYALLLMGIVFGFLVGWIAARWRKPGLDAGASLESANAQELKLAVNGKTVSLDASTSAEVQTLIRGDKTIEAIKALREATGLGLAEAKAVADSLARMIKQAQR